MSTDTATRRPRIDPRLAELMPPLDPETLAELEASIIRDGCHEPLSVWRGRDVLLDGRHRLDICTRHGLPYSVVEVAIEHEQEAREWIMRRQLAKRNLAPWHARYFRGVLYRQQRRDDRQNLRRGKQDSPVGQVDPPGNRASEDVAAATGVSERTVRRDAEFAAAVDRLEPEARAQVLNGKVPGLTRPRDVVDAVQAIEGEGESLSLAPLIARGKMLAQQARPRDARAPGAADKPFRQFAVKEIRTHVDPDTGHEMLDEALLTCGCWVRAKRAVLAATMRKAGPCPTHSGLRKPHERRIEQARLETNLRRAWDSFTHRPHLVELVKSALLIAHLSPGDARAESLREEIDRLARIAGLYDEPERGSSRGAAPDAFTGSSSSEPSDEDD